MLRIDAHQHFWNFDPVRDIWITEDMSVIRRSFLPTDLLPLLQQHALDGCVAVQADQSEEETAFLLHLASQYDFIKGVVGWIDLQADDIVDRLDYYQSFPVLKGFRHILQGEEDRALMLKPAFKRGIAALQPYGFTYDILIFPDQLKYVVELLESFPEQRFVIDHLAKPRIRDKEIKEWEKDMAAIAVYPNVYCKVSGLVTEADWKHWRPEDFTPYLDCLVKTFGTNRIMYGSDWPVCLVAASYEQTFCIIKEYFEKFPQKEQELIFGGNAVTFYKL